MDSELIKRQIHLRKKTCEPNYHLDGDSCVSNFKISNCPDIPVNADYSTSATTSVSWDGSKWVIESGQNDCSYFCRPNYNLNIQNGLCEPSTIQDNCSNLPANATY